MTENAPFMKSSSAHSVKRGFGGRVQEAIAFTGLNRAAFCRKYGFSYATVKSWKNEDFVISPRLTSLLVEALISEGVLCSEAWILRGEGPPAQRGEGPALWYRAHLISRALPLARQGIREFWLQEEIQQVWVHAQKKLHRFEIFRVGDAGMEPYYGSSDLVGISFAFNREVKDLEGKVCLIEVEPGHFTLRVLTFSSDDKIQLSPANTHFPSQTLSQFVRVGLVHWYRRVS